MHPRPAPPEPETVEVVLARPEAQRVVVVPLTGAMTAGQAVDASGLLAEDPGLAATPPLLGIYGVRVEADRLLRPGDRVEIYRPLAVDPREARRKRVAQDAETGRARHRR